MATCWDGSTDAGHPGNDYFVNAITGEIQRGRDLTDLFGHGDWSGPFTWCDAKAFAAGHTGSGIIHSPGQVAQAAISSNSPLGGLFQHNIWVRAAEFLIGVVLIGIGLNAMLKGRPLQVVTGAAGTVGKVVP